MMGDDSFLGGKGTIFFGHCFIVIIIIHTTVEKEYHSPSKFENNLKQTNF